MPTFTCWDESNEDEETAVCHLDAYDAESAAEEYAELCNNEGDFLEERTICVRDDEGNLTKWSVAAEVSYTYSACEVE